MAHKYSGLLFVAVVCFLKLYAAPASDNQDEQQLNPFLARSLLSTDFENGMGQWFDSSNGDVNWSLEAFDSPNDSPAPQLATGTKYLRVVRREEGSSGTAILRSSTFTANAGDEITFKFWIRSRHSQTNNLEVYLLNGGLEERLLSLSEYSSPSNFEWRTVSTQIPVTSATDVKIIFYGYCGYNVEDAIALDDIVVGSSSNTTPFPSTTLSTTTGYTPTTTTPSTTRPPCPEFMGEMAYSPCWEISTGCYCTVSYSVTSFVASSICQAHGTSLVSLETQEEDLAVRDLILAHGYSNGFHTSGRYDSATGTWVWGSGVKAEYSRWEESEPNRSGECLYLMYSPNFNWGDINCYNVINFICEF